MRSIEVYRRAIFTGPAEIPMTCEEARVYGAIEGAAEADGRRAIGRGLGGSEGAAAAAMSWANAYDVDGPAREAFETAFIAAYQPEGRGRGEGSGHPSK